MGNTSSDHNIKDALEELSDCRKIKTLEDAFWTSYFQSSTMPVEQLLEMVSLDDIRQIKSKNRSNFVTLCLHCMTQIFKSCKNSFWSQRHLLTVNNSVKWLIRLFPAVLEDKEMINYLWETKNDACLQPHAHCLLQNICELLFRQGYTVAQTTDAVYPPDPFNTQIIWKPGLVVTEATESNTFLDENRKLLLCLLLLLLSQELYLTRDESIIIQDKWSLWFKSKNNKYAILLFTSLINYVCYLATNFENSWSYFGKNKNDSMLYSCLHILMICLSTSCEAQEINDINQDKSNVNVFVELVESFHKKDDIDLIISSFHTLMKCSLIKKSFIFGNISHEFHQECLILLWRFCIYNQKFMNYLLISPHMPSIILILLIYLNEIKSDQSEIGFVHTTLSLLLFLSGERQFSIIMNSKYEGKNYFDLPKNCSYNDYLIYCLAKILVHGSENLTCLHETIASIIYNVSPYMTLTTMASSLTLLCLLETAVSNMSLDTSLETSYKVVSLLLDSFNNVLSHGFNNNSYVIFSMILSNKIFYKLDSLSNNTKSNSQIEDEGSHIFAFDKDALALFSTKNIIKFLDILVPQVEKLCEQIDDFDEEYVVKYLKRSTLVGIITKPTQIMARRFEVIENIANWIHLYTWTVIYLRNIDIPLYAGSKVNLFCQNKQQELN